ncbi:hypothetical protein AN960_08360 [Bacillus sp. FJAT-25509]|nr:hypothetical protein AN960_08360 [Bacillus sp. FJAT-25509]
MGYAGRLRPRRLAEEAKESRPMESVHPVVEINITKLPLRKFDNYLKRAQLRLDSFFVDSELEEPANIKLGLKGRHSY